MLTSLLLLMALTVGAQVPELEPVILPLEFSKEGEQKFEANVQRCGELYQMVGSDEDYKELSKADQVIYDNCDELNTEYWATMPDGCSWYCGGGSEYITASSSLKAQGSTTYNAENAHDGSYKNAWVEGVDGYGIGEYLEYHFNAQSARITTIHIANGYVKSASAWKNNSRVKKLKLLYNDEPYAILHLADVVGRQTFTIDPVGYPPNNREGKPEWTLKFEIMEVYKGEQYDDVVIAEIFFDGLDVHCLAEGTAITMADGSTKPIEEIQEGDEVMSVSVTGKQEPAKVEKMAHPVHEHMIRIRMSNGKVLECTEDHPIQTSRGWASYAPEKTKEAYDFHQVVELELRSLLTTIGDPVVILSIDRKHVSTPTHTIVKLSRNQRFIANGVVVGTEPLRKHTHE